MERSTVHRGLVRIDARLGYRHSCTDWELVAAADDPQLHEYRQKISGASAPGSQPPAPPTTTTTTPSGSDDTATADRRHRSKRKRRRQTVREPVNSVSQCDLDNAEAIEVLPQRAKQKMRRTAEEESREHLSVGNQDSQPLLGRRIRSMTAAAEANGETISHRLAQRSRRSRKPQTKPI
ncbi:unnamed protein product [Phytophthora fragariaefolia]|uniref:Unnamed protein product n=1 Tax=Phytophthora fragariaefolia TaxID=1490495 RepID=A0A9W7DC91_9STRA|nr:unnamed protein product [Phytophthora fragariaefolia]